MSAIDGLLFDEAAVAAPARFERSRHAARATPSAAGLAASITALQRRDRQYLVALVAGDLLAIFVALLAAGLLFGSVAPVATLIGVFPVVVLLGKLLGLYDRDAFLLHKTTLDEAPRIFQSTTLLAFGMWLLFANATRPQLLVFWLVGTAAVLAARAGARRLVLNAVAVERCVFIGDSAEYMRLATKLESRGSKAKLICCISPAVSLADGPGHSESLVALLGEAGAQRVIIEPHSLPSPDMLDLVRSVSGLGLRVSLLPKVLDVVGTAVEFDELDGMTLLGVRSFGLTRSSQRIKRAFDLAAAGLITLVVAPLMALISVAIMLDSGGPVFFRQVRIGRNGRPFTIWKFRTMVADAEERKQELRKLHALDDGLFKLEHDPRQTRVGRLLRKTSLDELPQLFNVLSGEMSLVGPRPLVVDEDRQIRGWDRRRLDLTPGMTGRWQIAGSARVPLPEMVKIDYLYAAGWTLWSDLKILLGTVTFVLSRRGM